MLFLLEKQREDTKCQGIEKKKGENINTTEMTANTGLHQYRYSPPSTNGLSRGKELHQFILK